MRISNRLEKLRQKLTEKEVDAILISQPENRYYLSRFDGSAGSLLITSEKAVLATDFRYTEQAQNQAPDYEIFRITGEMVDWFPKLLADFALKSLGFEAGHLTFSTHQRLSDILNKAQPSLKLVPLESLVESLRAIKEPEEIELITRAVKVADAALNYIGDKIEAGQSEKDAAWEIEQFIRKQGSQALPFEVIVASGPHAALPHHKPSSRTISTGEPVIIDIGAKVEGYCSDLTRTIYLGKHDDKFNKVYDAVVSAQMVAITMARSGMTGNEIDELGRKMIEQEGYGEAFGHGLGHGIGLAPHEQPRLGPNSNERVEDGMVFTIEPGIYILGWGGVRIEDVGIMENGKVRVISRARKM